MENISALGSEVVSIDQAGGRVAAVSVTASVDSPSVDASLMDGYAVISEDLNGASEKQPVKLIVIGSVAAGTRPEEVVRHGTAIRILTGAPLPQGADAVIPEEHTRKEGTRILALVPTAVDSHVLHKGSDVQLGEMLVEAGRLLSPPRIALLVAGGIQSVAVHKRPAIGLLATGTELLACGEKMEKGKLFASNMALHKAWLESQGIKARTRIAGDTEAEISDAIIQLHEETDGIITSGGAWKGDRDLVVKVLDRLGWDLVFHRVRMGPGKAMGMGVLKGKPVFCLPGGPAANETAFNMIAFPAVLKMAGYTRCPYLFLKGVLERDITGKIGWTEFVNCEVVFAEGKIMLRPRRPKSRLAGFGPQAVVKIPETETVIPKGSCVPCICLTTDDLAFPIIG